jgi:ribosome-binding factor A
MKMVDELVLQELSRELRLRFPEDLFSLTQTHVSKDLANAKIWVSAVQNSSELVKKFNHIASDLRHILSKKIVARRVPRLHFVIDETEEKAAKIDQLLSSINNK